MEMDDTVESRKRSIAKSITFRAVSVVLLCAVTLMLTGNLLATAYITVAFQSIQTMFYYAHERAWNHTRWGKLEAEEVPGEAPVPSEMADRRIESAELSPSLAEDP